MSLPPNWATLVQPPPRNHGTPAIEALRPGQPLRTVIGDMLADAAIARAAVGEKTYGSKLTPNNGRDQAIDALQELADAAAYLAAWRAEIGSMDDDDAFSESEGVECAMHQLNDLAWTIHAAAKYRAKRLAKAKGGEGMSRPKFNARGFRAFGELRISNRVVRVVESSLAFDGPHVRVFHDVDGVELDGGHHDALHLNLAEAKLVASALAQFVAEAEAGKLTEKP